MANDVHASIIIGSDSSQAKKDMDSLSKTAIKQWDSIDKAIKKVGGTIAQVEQGLEELGAGDLLGKLGKGLQLSSNEMKSLRSVIARVGYDVEQAQAKAALSTQSATQKIQEQTKATNQLAQATTAAGNAKKAATGQLTGAGTAKGKTGIGLLVEQERGINQVGMQLGQLEIEKERAAHKLADREQATADTASLIRLRELADQRARLMASTEEKIRAERRKTAAEEKEQRQANGALLRREMSERGRDATKLNSIMTRALKAEAGLRQQIIDAIEGEGKAGERVVQRLVQGQSVTQAFFNQLTNKGISQQNANFLTSGGKMPAGFAGAGAGGGGGGIWQKILGTLGFGSGGGFAGSLVRGGLGAAGIGAGFYGVKALADAGVEAAKSATAYDRMEVSARKLAGSQSQLNELLAAYETAAGGAVDQATALESVIKLQATGFASSAAEIERFVRGARGAALSLGKPQENITQETQLAISNTSVKRLDQIGLGIAEVDKRTKELRQTNKGWTREMAFQEAVIGLLNEKYGDLSDTVEGQATGIEKLSTTWADLMLMVGQGLQKPLNDAAADIDKFISAFQKIPAAWNAVKRSMGGLGLVPEGWNWDQAGWSGDPSAPNESAQAMGRRRQEADAPFAEEKQQLAIQRAETLERIQKDSDRAIIDENRSYFQQLVDTNNSYYKTLARDNEDYQRSRAKSEAAFARSIAEVQEDAEEREVEAARDLLNQIVRMNRDAARDEARARRDLNRSIEKMHEEHADKVKDIEKEYQRSLEEAREDSTERLQEMQVDYDEKIAEARQDSIKRLADMEKDYDKERFRSKQKYEQGAMQAAASLDAKALWMEQQRYVLEMKQAAEAHQDAITKEKENLSEFEREADKDHRKAIAEEKKRLKEFEDEAEESHKRRLEEETESLQEREDEEKEALELRLQDARENLRLQQEDLIAAHAAQKIENDAADLKRLNDMKAAHILEQGEAEADRIYRLGRLAIDHQDQLKELGTQHANRITQIGIHAQAERDKLDEEQEKALGQLGIYIEGFSQQYQKLTNAAIKGFDDFMLHVEEKFSEESRLTPEDRAEIASLEAEKPGLQAIVDEKDNPIEMRNAAQKRLNEIDRRIEEIKRGDDDPVKTSEIVYSAGGSSVQPVSNSATAGATVGGGIVIQSGAIQITAYPGQSPASLGDEFEKRLLSVVKQISRSSR